MNREFKSKNAKYSPAIRSFALTLQFYSSKAYSYVRKIFKNLLPHPATLKKWYSVVEGEPGFTKETFNIISLRVKQNTSTQPIVCNIVIDEMAIRKQIIFMNNKFYGGVDLGTQNNYDQDNTQEATNVLVFLAVCLNGHWKVPLGYFLIHSFSGSERANLLTRCLELFSETGAICRSITFDGAQCNMVMCKMLGANFDYLSTQFKPWIQNPAFPDEPNKRIYIFWDAAHMVKLVRNTLGDKKVLINNNGKQIKWNDIQTLQEIQESKGLHAANKLKQKHIRFYENKMNVCLAVQTLSSSVSHALLLCDKLNYMTEVEGTAEFCKIFNDAFDLCNCRNKLSKRDYSFPVNNKTLSRIKDFLYNFKKYVEGLRYESNQTYPHGELLLNSQRKTGFLGIIICLTNIINLFENVEKENLMSFLLSYKLSQDYIEVFFSAIRSRGGFNNNPNVVQFRSAYKRLLVRHEIGGSTYGNCTILDNADTENILFVSANKRMDADAICNNDLNDTNDIDEQILFEEFEHDYEYRVPELEDFIIDIVKYTCGFIVRKMRRAKNICNICDSFLTEKDDKNSSILYQLKTRGKLINSSSDVHKTCLAAEYIIRLNSDDILKKKNIH